MQASRISIDVSVQAGVWPGESELENWCRTAVDAAAAEAGVKIPKSGAELGIVFTDDADIAALNAEWRGKDKPTNVLSFPASQTVIGAPLPPLLGDIILADGIVSSEAVNEGKTLQDHAKHLVIHGFLHLIGYDHETDEDAELMEGLERRALARLAIADPYE